MKPVRILRYTQLRMDKIKVVLADAQAIVREGTRLLLEREADMAIVGEATTGEEVVRLVESLKPDVVLLDIAMPKLDGTEVTRRIKSRFPSVAILVLTAFDAEESVFALLEAGAAGYLLKNSFSREVVEAIRAVHAGESVLHPSIARKVIQRAIRGTAKLPGIPAGAVLSRREIEVLKLAARGRSNTEIAGDLGVSVRTVQGHINGIFRKLGVDSRTRAVSEGIKKNLLSFEDLK